MSGLGSTISHDPKKIASVATVDDLNNYPVGLRQWGLRVAVTADNLVRELVYLANSGSLSDNANWIVEGGSLSQGANANIYQKSSGYAYGASTGRAHPVREVTSGPASAVYHVEATVVVAASGGATGGSLVIAGTFKKNAAGELAQIGVTQTPYAAQEDIAGALAASFTISPSLLALEVLTATAGENCITHVHCRVTTVTNSI